MGLIRFRITISLLWFLCSVGFAGTSNRLVTVTEKERVEIARLDPKGLTLFVIEGLSSGAGYAPTARELFPQIQIVHIQHGLVLNPALAASFNRSHYDANVIYTGHNREPLAELLKPFKQGHLEVVAASETGVESYDEITELLGVPNNGTLSGKALRNKFWMAEIAKPFLEKVGIETIPGLATNDAKTALTWIHDRNIEYPVFVKPVESAGSFGGSVCHSAHEIRSVFARLVGKSDPLGKIVEQLIVQPTVKGDGLREVVSNGVFDSEVGFVGTDFFEYNKRRERKPIYLGSKLRKWDLRNPVHVKLLKGAEALGEAFAVRNAALHPEFFVLGDRVIFIEVGRRVAGGGMPQFVRACGGMDQIKLHLLSLFDREHFLRLARPNPAFPNLPSLAPLATTEGNMMDLIYDKKVGIVRSVPSAEELRQRIPGFLSASLPHLRVGDWIGSTSNLFDSPGIVLVKGDDQVMDQAEIALRNWEASTFYDVRRPGICEWLFFKLGR